MMIELWIVGSMLGAGLITQQKKKNDKTVEYILALLFALMFSWFAVGVMIGILIDNFKAKK